VILDLVDTHAHLHFPEFAGDLEAVLERARAAGVRCMVTIGTDVESSRAAVALAGREPDVWAAVGIHPHAAGLADEARLAEIERLAAAPRVVAIGETGLDFFRLLSPRDAQERRSGPSSPSRAACASPCSSTAGTPTRRRSRSSPRCLWARRAASCTASRVTRRSPGAASIWGCSSRSPAR